MSFNWSEEQEHIFSEISNLIEQPENSIVTINAIAGSSKTTTLVELAKRLTTVNPSTRINYLVFGSLASQEARLEFKHTAAVSTLHKLAHDYTIKQTSMHLSQTGFMSWKDIPKSIKRPFGIDMDAINLLNAFCESGYNKLEHYCLEENIQVRKPIITLTKELYKLAALGTIPCTHSVYLKVFHNRLMNGSIQLPEVDVLLIDEIQDLSTTTLDVINKIPAKVKVLVGDPKQAIFSFMGCKNAFDIYTDATKLHLTKSFRVNTPIANKIEIFMQSLVDPDFVFKGMEYPIPLPPIKTKGYITRTNSSLISKMIELNETNTPYRLSTGTKINQMFELPLAILRALSGQPEKNKKYKYLEQDANDYRSSDSLQEQYATLLPYLIANNKDNPAIEQAANLIMTHTPQGIVNAYNSAKSHLKSGANLQLLTGHTSKGTTLDEVTLADDMNESIEDIMEDYIKSGIIPTKQEEIAELFLYYVAISRCRYKLNNAKWLGDTE